jgi:hypothetical protein
MSKSSENAAVSRWHNYLHVYGLIRVIYETGKRLRWQSIDGEWVATASSLGNGPRVEVFRLTAQGLGNKWNSQLVHPDDSPDRYAELVETIFLQEVLRED